MKDKYGKRIKIGDWVYVEWYYQRNQPRVGIIERTEYWDKRGVVKILFKGYNLYPTAFPKTHIEKLPEDEQKRNEILMLRKFEQ